MIVCGGDVDCISYRKIFAMAQSEEPIAGYDRTDFRFCLRLSIRQSE